MGRSLTYWVGSLLGPQYTTEKQLNAQITVSKDNFHKDEDIVWHPSNKDPKSYPNSENYPHINLGQNSINS